MGVAIESNLKENIRDIKVCTYFTILKVKVPIIFSGTEGFPARRDGRYSMILLFDVTFTTLTPILS